jgi:hypothetical protein
MSHSHTAWTSDLLAPRSLGGKKGKGDSISGHDKAAESKEVRRLKNLIHAVESGIYHPSTAIEGCLCRGMFIETRSSFQNLTRFQLTQSKETCIVEIRPALHELRPRPVFPSTSCSSLPLLSFLAIWSTSFAERSCLQTHQRTRFHITTRRGGSRERASRSRSEGNRGSRWWIFPRPSSPPPFNEPVECLTRASQNQRAPQGPLPQLKNEESDALHILPHADAFAAHVRSRDGG